MNNAISTNPVINTTRLENTLDETGPYVVEADIVDDGSVQNATLTYQIMGQEAVSAAMSSQGDDRYTGDIPGQPLGTTIVYFVSAEDNQGNETRDSNFTFAIAEPEDDGCGCGRPAIDVAIEDANLKSTVNTVANACFFLLPFVAIKFHAARRRKKNG